MKDIIICIISICFLILLIRYFVQNYRLKIAQCDAVKYESLYKLLAQWLETKQNGLSLKTLLNQKGYSSVAIYGVYLLGERLLVELRDLGVDVLYGIDKKKRDTQENLPVYLPSDQLPQVDVVIVTSIREYEAIKQELQKRVTFPIVALDDLICELSVL